MKTLLSIAVGLVLGVNAFASGVTPINASQSGILYFTNSGPTSITNQLNPGFTYPPAMQAFFLSGATNALPITVTATTTNYIVTVNAATNAVIAWSANPAAALAQFGQIITVAGVPYTNTFGTAYAYAPTVVASPAITNAAASVAVYNVSTTSFVLLSNTAQTNQWISIGETYSGNAGTQTVTH